MSATGQTKRPGQPRTSACSHAGAPGPPRASGPAPPTVPRHKKGEAVDGLVQLWVWGRRGLRRRKLGGRGGQRRLGGAAVAVHGHVAGRHAGRREVGKGEDGSGFHKAGNHRVADLLLLRAGQTAGGADAAGMAGARVSAGGRASSRRSHRRLPASPAPRHRGLARALTLLCSSSGACRPGSAYCCSRRPPPGCHSSSPCSSSSCRGAGRMMTGRRQPRGHTPSAHTQQRQGGARGGASRQRSAAAALVQAALVQAVMAQAASQPGGAGRGGTGRGRAGRAWISKLYPCRASRSPSPDLSTFGARDRGSPSSCTLPAATVGGRQGGRRGGAASAQGETAPPRRLPARLAPPLAPQAPSLAPSLASSPHPSTHPPTHPHSPPRRHGSSNHPGQPPGRTRHPHPAHLWGVGRWGWRQEQGLRGWGLGRQRELCLGGVACGPDVAGSPRRRRRGRTAHAARRGAAPDPNAMPRRRLLASPGPLGRAASRSCSLSRRKSSAPCRGPRGMGRRGYCEVRARLRAGRGGGSGRRHAGARAGLQASQSASLPRRGRALKGSKPRPCTSVLGRSRYSCVFSAATVACWPQPAAASRRPAASPSPSPPLPPALAVGGAHTWGERRSMGRSGGGRWAAHVQCPGCQAGAQAGGQASPRPPRLRHAPMPLPWRHPIFCSRRMPMLSATGATISSGRQAGDGRGALRRGVGRRAPRQLGGGAAKTCRTLLWSARVAGMATWRRRR